MSARLEDLRRCFDGVMPSIIATCDLAGEPNVTYLSQVHYLDPTHVALSCQFFNKTRRNVEENPYATITLHDPVSFEAWRLSLRFEHAETEGPLFEEMSARIDVIASHTGMAGVFRLLSADVYEVLAVEPIAGFLVPPDPVLDRAEPIALPDGPYGELRGLQVVCDRVARADDLDGLLGGALEALEEMLGFTHAIVFLAEDGPEELLRPVASRGYGEEVRPCEVAVGGGLVGTVARRRRPTRVGGMGSELRYGRTVRAQAEANGGPALPEVPLPGLPDAQAQLGIPLLAGDRLVGVLLVESQDPVRFDPWDETFLQIVGNQIASGVERVRARAATTGANGLPARRFTLYRNDDCVFFEDRYLVRNVPGLILWKLLGLHAREGRTEFTNRELRLDPSLGLPKLKDNLESRLILLRKRLEEKCPEVRLVQLGRGRFALELDCTPVLAERETG